MGDPRSFDKPVWITVAAVLAAILVAILACVFAVAVSIVAVMAALVITDLYWQALVSDIFSQKAWQ